jgi:hypothetical protein
MYHFNRVLSLPAADTTVFVHPRMFPIHNMAAEHGTAAQSGEILLPPGISLSGEKLESTGAYMIDNGESILVFIGKDCNQSFLEQAFGIHHLGENEAGRLYFENKGNPLSQKVGIQPVTLIESKPWSAPFFACFDMATEVAPAKHVSPLFAVVRNHRQHQVEATFLPLGPGREAAGHERVGCRVPHDRRQATASRLLRRLPVPDPQPDPVEARLGEC